MTDPNPQSVTEPELAAVAGSALPAWAPAPSAHDWPEDYADTDNGCYQHRCTTCDAIFHGHKRRPNQCKVCATKAQERWDALTPEQQATERAESERRIRDFFAKQNKD